MSRFIIRENVQKILMIFVAGIFFPPAHVKKCKFTKTSESPECFQGVTEVGCGFPRPYHFFFLTIQALAGFRL